MKDNSVLMRVTPEFRKKLKLKATEEGKTVLQLTDDLSKDIPRGLKKNEFFVKF